MLADHVLSVFLCTCFFFKKFSFQQVNFTGYLFYNSCTKKQSRTIGTVFFIVEADLSFAAGSNKPSRDPRGEGTATVSSFRFPLDSFSAIYKGQFRSDVCKSASNHGRSNRMTPCLRLKRRTPLFESSPLFHCANFRCQGLYTDDGQ